MGDAGRKLSFVIFLKPPLPDRARRYADVGAFVTLLDRINRILRIFLLYLKFPEEIPNEQSATPRREPIGGKVLLGVIFA